MIERVGRLLSKIPGYDAYSTKESMRDDDRRLREQVAGRLDQAVSDLTAISARLASRRQLGAVGPVEDLVRDTRLMAGRVRSASYGYEGLFSDRKVDEFALGQIKAFDVAFDSQVEGLVAEIASVGDEGEEVESQIRDVSTRIDDLDRLFNARNDVIVTASPATDPSVLKLLESPVTLTQKELLLLDVASAGTVAILGDNFQIQAHIKVRDRAGKVMLSLLRLDEGPEWLAVVHEDGVACWRVRESSTGASAATPPAAGTLGNATVSGPQGTQDHVSAQYDVRVTDSEGSLSVSVDLSLGGERRNYSGVHAPMVDIEVYSTGHTD